MTEACCSLRTFARAITGLTVAVATALLLAGCAGVGDLKPGVARRVDKRGFVETTDGYGIAVRGCSDQELWATILETAKTLEPVAPMPFQENTRFGPLRILDADPRRGVIRAKDPQKWGKPTSYVGIFLHPPKDDIRLIEVSALWEGRTATANNPWEGSLLRAFRERLPCVIPSEHAIPPITGHRDPIEPNMPVYDSASTSGVDTPRHRAEVQPSWEGPE